MTRAALTDLLADVAVAHVDGALPATITGVTDDSRAVQPGGLFVALPGAAHDGNAFVDDAIRAGAAVIVRGGASKAPATVPTVWVDDPRTAVAQLAAAWHGHPSRQLRLVGITGTSGKTTLTFLLEAIWRAVGGSPGVIGTVNNRYAGRVDDAPTTTPGACALHALLARMVAAGVTDVAMEVSSHALQQQRVAATDFNGAVFTNLSHDHLDYHGSMAAYAQAKALLFSTVLGASCKMDRFAVINADDAGGAQMAEQSVVPVTWYGVTSATAAVRPLVWRDTAQGIHAEYEYAGAPLVIDTALIGRFNVDNITAAVAAAQALRVPADAVRTALAQMRPVPGRMDVVAHWRGATIVVDYAHKPDALQRVLQAARGLATARVVTVFGCGGDRDAAKRPLMGQIAATLSDCVIVTNDNPRTEDPAAIAAAIVAGMTGAAPQVELDRRTAIESALESARKGDVIVIAGKGHETYQIVGRTTQHFDDTQVVREYIARTGDGVCS